MGHPIILASASPRRKELLERLGFSVMTIPSNVVELRDEDESPENFVKRMARDKVLSVVERLRANLSPADELPQRGGIRFPSGSKEAGARWVIGADTIVVVDDNILGKPENNTEAIEMLMMLTGQQHMVLTGFCIFDLAKNKEGIQAVKSGVLFKAFTREECEKYVSLGESLDKAGAYAIQGIGAYLADSITGSYTNVVGLPLCQVVEMMQEMGPEDVLPF